ncbi:5-carboxymethyl-2-hydroxymuconate Delta-isomerase [Denitratisoma sp. agr-D3]
MPHLTLEYTDNLGDFPAATILARLNTVLAGSGQFEEVDIKSRARRLDCYAIGTASTGRAFVHVRLSLLSGRSPQIKQELSAALLAALAECQPRPATLHVQLSVELQDMARECYGKASLGPG